jgi:hypothetical protein
MRARFLLLFTIPLFLGGCFTLRPPSLAGVTEIFRGEEWEYRQELDCRDATQSASAVATSRTEMMNRLGKSRWELVDIESVAAPTDASSAERCSVFTFKRRLEK